MWSMNLAAVIYRRRRRRHESRERRQNDELPDICVQVTNAMGRRTGRDGEVAEGNNHETANTRMPLLYALARSWAWDAVAFRCRSHPEEAQMNWSDNHGDNILHWAAFGRPPFSPVRILLDTAPELAKVRNNKGLLPLHVACSYRASNDVVQAILNAYPEAAGEATDSGSYPLHLLCDYGSSVELVRSIVETEAGVATVFKLDRTYKRTPLQILNGRKNLNIFLRSLETIRTARVRQRALRAERAHGQEEELQRLAQGVSEFKTSEFWQKAVLLMLVECQSSPLEDDDFTDAWILHACLVCQDAPPSVQEFAILLYEDQLLIPDENGQLPLHTAAMDGTPSLLLDILAANPSAASERNREGCLPLQFAVRHRNRRWSDGAGQLVEAYPAALDEINIDDRLYPKVWSRLSSSDVLFRAIRTRPQLFLSATE